MDMIDRYLNAIAAQLPQHARADITAELRDLILSRCEGKEEELGRVLTDDERQGIMRQIGHPLVVAARYRQGPDHLVGPEWFPYWLFGVKAGLLILGAAFALGLLGDLITHAPYVAHTIGQALHGFFWSGLSFVGGITLVVAFLDHNAIKPRWLTHWRASDLTAFGLADPSAWRTGMGRLFRERSTPASRWPGSEHITSLIVNSVFLVWWIGILHIPGWSNFDLHGHHVNVVGAPIWTALHNVILAYALACIAVDFVGLARPYGVRLQAVLEMAAASVGLWLLWKIFQAGHWFTVIRDSTSVRIEGGAFLLGRGTFESLENNPDALEKMATSLSIAMTICLAGIGVALVFKIVRAIWRLAHTN